MFLFDRIHEVSAAMASRDPLRCLRLNDSLSHAAPWQLNELTREFSWTTQRVGGVAGAKRFALEPDTVRAMVSVLSSRPQSLQSCLEVLRIPWPTAWLEWDEVVRMEALREVSPASWAPFDGDDVVVPSKVGVLAEVDPAGRSGRFRTAWSSALYSKSMHAAVSLVSASTAEVEFDFDAPKGYLVLATKADGRRVVVQDLVDKVEQSVLAIGAEPTAGNIAAMRHILSHFQIVFDCQATERCVEVAFARDGVDPRDPRLSREELSSLSEKQMAHFARDVLAEILPFLATMMLMTAVGGVEARSSNLAKLNKQRGKRGEVAKLEHDVIHIRLDRGQREALRALGRGSEGALGSRRPHMVGGHFVRRNGKIFWRRGHMRGLTNDRAPGKTYVVRGAPALENILAGRW